MPMLLEVVTFCLAGLEAESGLPKVESQCVGNAARLHRALQIPLIPNFSSMVSKNGAIDLCPPNPFGGFR